MTVKERVRYLEELQKEITKNQKLYQKKLIVDTVRRKYSDLWLHKRMYREKVREHLAGMEGAPERDLILISPRSLKRYKN